MSARKEKFTHHGADYEVRAAQVGEEWKIAVFDAKGNKVTAESSISTETVDDMKTTGASADPVKHMMDEVQRRFTS